MQSNINYYFDYLAINFVVVDFASTVSSVGLVADIVVGIAVVVVVVGIAVVVAIDCFDFVMANLDFLGFPKKLTNLTNFPIPLADYSNLLANIEDIVEEMYFPNYSTLPGFGFDFDFVNYYWFVVQFVQ